MKSKRVLTVLLSMAIMLTFMPVMSFAAVDSNIQPGSKPHVWYVDETKSIPATCQSEGLTIYSCKGNEELGLTCEAMKADFVDVKDHHTAKANPIQLSKDDLIKRLASEWSLSAEQVDNLYKENVGNCYAFAYECKECGKVPMSADFIAWQGHKKPAGTPACAESYVCEFCGQTVLTGVSNDHRYGQWSEARQYVCGDADAHYGYEVQQRTCSVCGKVETRQHWVGGNTHPESQAKHGALEEYVVVAPTCENKGTKAQRCTECGKDVPYDDPKKAEIPALGHSFETLTFDATCTQDSYSYKRCSRCALKNNYTYNVGSKLGHKYVAEVIFEPNCDAEGITRITCVNGCGYSRFASSPRVASHLRYVDSNGVSHRNKQDGYKIYFVGQNNEYVDDQHSRILDGAIELADWTAKTHDWGKFEDMKAADCTHGTMQAAKCKVCGHYDAHTAVQTGEPVGHKYITISQEPTCGAEGFTADVCSVCGDTKNAHNVGKPKVGYGAKCDFSKWVVETAATPFEEGTKKLICRNCGDDGNLVLEGGRVKELGVTRAAIAKTKIAAPKVKAGKKKATVTVKAVEGAVKYQIKVNGKVKKTVTSAKKVTIKKLKGGKKAKFQIVAFNAEGVKAASKVKSVKIKK